MRVSDDGYQLDTDRGRLDLDRVEHWLSGAYWSLGRSRAMIERSIAGSTAYGLYGPSGEQVAFFRVVTDHATFAWLCDVFVDEAHRGRGLAQWAVAHIRDDLQAEGVYRIILATSDAHGVYAKVGFEPLAAPERMMALITPARTA